MRFLRLSHVAQADIEGILLHSQMMFGAAARRRYEALLEQALRDIAADPDCIGVKRRDDLGGERIIFCTAAGLPAARAAWSKARATSSSSA